MGKIIVLQSLKNTRFNFNLVNLGATVGRIAGPVQASRGGVPPFPIRRGGGFFSQNVGAARQEQEDVELQHGQGILLLCHVGRNLALLPKKREVPSFRTLAIKY